MHSMDIMYRIIEIMAVMRLPVVFKGALVLNQALKEMGMTSNFRQTRDIDLNWLNGNVSNEELTNTITEAVNLLGVPNLRVVSKREANIERDTSAGISIKRGTTDLFSFDISLKDNPFTAVYKTNSGVNFLGSSLHKIFADKVRSASHVTLVRRSKDIYDLYVMSSISGYSIKNTLEIHEYESKGLGEFDVFLRKIPDLRHAYNRLEGIHNKPSFDVAYRRVRDFCIPFITGEYRNFVGGTDGVWDAEACMWVVV